MPKYLLYYAGFNSKTCEEQIGIAESFDLENWKYKKENPIVPLKSQGLYDQKQSSNPCVLRHRGLYKMWYQGKSEDGLISICYAESSDGRHWQVNKEIVFSPLPTQKGEYLFGYHHPHVIFDEVKEIFKMWCVVHKGGLTSIGYTESIDGKRWNEMIMTNLSSPNKELKYFYPFILAEDDGYRLWLTERKLNRKWKILTANSADGKNWLMDEGHILDPSFNKFFILFFEILAKFFKIFVKLPIYGIGSPYVWKKEKIYFLIGHEIGPRGKLYIPMYQSNDGLDWKKMKNNILPNSNSAWDSFFQADPYLYVEQ